MIREHENDLSKDGKVAQFDSAAEPRTFYTKASYGILQNLEFKSTAKQANRYAKKEADDLLPEFDENSSAAKTAKDEDWELDQKFDESEKRISMVQASSFNYHDTSDEDQDENLLDKTSENFERGLTGQSLPDFSLKASGTSGAEKIQKSLKTPQERYAEVFGNYNSNANTDLKESQYESNPLKQAENMSEDYASNPYKKVKPQAFIKPVGKKPEDDRYALSRDSMLSHTSAHPTIAVAQKDNISVVIRIRPLNDRELATGIQKQCLIVENKTKLVLDRGIDTKAFNFDFVADESVQQPDIFNAIARPIADSCMQGYNGSIFAYGQTGSGKTFTIQGPQVQGHEAIYEIVNEQNSSGKQFEMRGLMQRSFEHIFTTMDNEKAEAERNGSEVQYLIKCSYLEIYNEQIMDLLEPTSQNMHIREDIKKGVYVDGLVEETVSGVRDMTALITRGSRNRHVGSTSMNKESSRSHSVLTTQIESKTMKSSGVWQMRSSRFHIIDLAGSERSKHTNAVGERLKEAGMINKSLSALGIVINSLVEISEGKQRHVHYRDSKLTFLLRDSLGGNSKTLIVANITPAYASIGETLSTLKFAQRAKLIKNKAVINEESSGTIQLLKQEIRRLKKELAEATNDRIQLESRLKTDSSLSGVCNNCKTLAHQSENMMLTDDLMASQEINSSHDCSIVSQTDPSASSSSSKVVKKLRTEIQNLQQRVVHLEGLLVDNLDNLTNQQKYFESESTKQNESRKRLQTALQTFERQSARDKMIIKFREERISKLEQTSKDGAEGCLECDNLVKEVSRLKEERDEWKDAVEKNPKVAKLFAEKADLLKERESLEAELKTSPESMSAQIRSLNELTERLASYLKEHCEAKNLQVKKEKVQLTEQVESLTAEIESLSQTHTAALQKTQDDHFVVVQDYYSKLESIKKDFAAEKLVLENSSLALIEKIKQDLVQKADETVSQEEQLKTLRIDLFERETSLNQQLAALNLALKDSEQALKDSKQDSKKTRQDLEKVREELSLSVEDRNTQIESLTNQFEADLSQAEDKYKTLDEKHSKKKLKMEKLLMEAQSEIQALKETKSDLEDQLQGFVEENEQFQKQLIEGSEDIQETRRHLREIEGRLQTTIIENQKKVDALMESKVQLQRDLEQTLETLTQVKQRESEMTQNWESEVEASSKSSSEVQELKTVIEALELKITKLQTAEEAWKEQLDANSTLVKDLQNNLTQKLVEIEQNETKNYAVQLEYEEKRDSFDQLIKDHEEKFVQLKKDHHEKANQLKKDHQEKVQVLANEVTHKTEQVSDLSKQIAVLQDECVTLQNERDAMDDITVRLTHENKAFEEELSDTKKELSLQQQKFQQTQKITTDQISSLKTEITSQNLQKDLLQTQILKATAATNANNDTVAKFEKQLADKNAEIDQLKVKFQHVLKALQLLQKAFQQIRKEYSSFGLQVQKELNWTKINPQTVVFWQQAFKQTLDSAKFKTTSQLGQFHNDEIKVLQKQLQDAQKKHDHKVLAAQQDVLELKEQLLEYKGLAQQLTDEKSMLNNQLGQELSQRDKSNLTSNTVIEQLNNTVMLQQRQLVDASAQLQKSQVHVERQLQQLTSQFQNEKTILSETHFKQLKKLEEEQDKIKRQNMDLQEALKASKKKINELVEKEDELMRGLSKKISELGEQQVTYKSKGLEYKSQTEHAKIQAERLKNETDTLREKIRLREQELEQKQAVEIEVRLERDRLKTENIQLTEALLKRETEMKEVVRTLKRQLDENKQQKKEIDALRKDVDVQVGHMNHNQKIHYVEKIKDENNRLRDENCKLQEELTRKIELFSKPGLSEKRDEEVLKLSRDTIQLYDAGKELIKALMTVHGVQAFLEKHTDLKEALWRHDSSNLSSTQLSQVGISKFKASLEVVKHLGRSISLQQTPPGSTNTQTTHPYRRTNSSSAANSGDTSAALLMKRLSTKTSGQSSAKNLLSQTQTVGKPPVQATVQNMLEHNYKHGMTSPATAPQVEKENKLAALSDAASFLQNLQQRDRQDGFVGTQSVRSQFINPMLPNSLRKQ